MICNISVLLESLLWDDNFNLIFFVKLVLRIFITFVVKNICKLDISFCWSINFVNPKVAKSFLELKFVKIKIESFISPLAWAKHRSATDYRQLLWRRALCRTDFRATQQRSASFRRCNEYISRYIQKLLSSNLKQKTCQRSQ